jgi:hypothetical protein
MKKAPEILDKVADIVLAYRPKQKKKSKRKKANARSTRKAK